ncbi:unnamed protein product [Orchesella dallaii]|uniref:Uncharacterized protein n=1 Tax=Orchesella dallaii TaxID=48710 RepID=A0ABP1Q3B5_9HEXA
MERYLLSYFRPVGKFVDLIRSGIRNTKAVPAWTGREQQSQLCTAVQQKKKKNEKELVVFDIVVALLYLQSDYIYTHMPLLRTIFQI